MKLLLRSMCLLAAIAWPSLAAAQNGVPYSANVQMPTFVIASGAGGADLLFYPDATWSIGASGATRPKDIFFSGTATGASISLTSSATLGACGSTNEFRWTSGSLVGCPANGIITVTNNARTIGSEFKADALPTASACGAGSPAAVAGSTPLSGAVTVGTGGPTTCTITFNGTAYPSAPHCNGAVETTTAGNARMMGYSASTTVLTITPSAAWADSSVVNWDCFSSK